MDFTFRAVEEIRDRLDNALVQEADHVACVESTLEATRDEQPPVPAVIVFPVADEPQPGQGGRAATVQRVTGRIGVLHVIGAPNDPQGQEARQETGEAIARTRGLLAGWTPEGATGPLSLLTGRLEAIADGRVYWLDHWGAEWVLSSQPQDRAA